MTITVWTKIGCGWCRGVTALLRRRGLPFEERVVTWNRARMAELVRKSGQSLAPVVEIDGHLLVDTDAGEVERYLNAVARAERLAPGGHRAPRL